MGYMVSCETDDENVSSVQWIYSILSLPRFFRCGLLVFALLKLCRYHQQENIRVSIEQVISIFHL